MVEVIVPEKRLYLDVKPELDDVVQTLTELGLTPKTGKPRVFEEGEVYDVGFAPPYELGKNGHVYASFKLFYYGELLNVNS